MKKMMLVCSLMLCVIMAACSKKAADSDKKEEKTEFNAKSAVEKINKGEKLSDEEFLGAVQFVKDATDARDKAMQEENPDIDALEKKYEGIETIYGYVDNQTNWIGYKEETIKKAAGILGISTDQLKSAITSGGSDDSEYMGYDEGIEIEPDFEAEETEYAAEYAY